jgi:hypothetical protein
MAENQIRFSEWIRLDDNDILHVDVQLRDCASLLPFLRACNLQFDCTELESGGEDVAFQPGTTIGQVHNALVRFDERNRPSR